MATEGAKVLYDADIDMEILKGRKIAVIGYGNQGHAQAQNLRDSGMDVIVAEVEGSPAWEKAKSAGFEVMSASEAAKRADYIQMLIPDELQPDVYNECIRPHLKEGDILGFSHGFNIHYGQIVPPEYVDVVMVAPKAPGKLVRELFVKGMGTPALVCVHQDFSGKAREYALAYAKAIGAGRAGILEGTFAEETEEDLFGEQAVICGGVIELVKKGFEVLVEAGYPPELAYFETYHELKLIVDLMYERGIYGMLEAISNTAKYGALTRGPYVIDDSVKERMRKVLEDVRNGKFATEWILENKVNRPRFRMLMERIKSHPIEEVGKRVRGMIPWLGKK